MHRKNILKEVMTIVSARSETHGNPQENLSLATALKETVRGGSRYTLMTAAEREALDQIMTKASRIVCGQPDRQHWDDVIGYASIASESRSLVKERDEDNARYYGNQGDVQGTTIGSRTGATAGLSRKLRK